MPLTLLKNLSLIFYVAEIYYGFNIII